MNGGPGVALLYLQCNSWCGCPMCDRSSNCKAVQVPMPPHTARTAQRAAQKACAPQSDPVACPPAAVHPVRGSQGRGDRHAGYAHPAWRNTAAATKKNAARSRGGKERGTTWPRGRAACCKHDSGTHSAVAPLGMTWPSTSMSFCACLCAGCVGKAGAGSARRHSAGSASWVEASMRCSGRRPHRFMHGA